MDLLRSIDVFITVAHGVTFSAAAKQLSMSRGNVSKHIAWLENRLGARLFTRTTKSVRLTAAGLNLLENGRELLARAEEIEAGVRSTVSSPRGVVRVGTPPSFGAYHLMPLISVFSRTQPEIRIVLYLDDGGADLVSNGLDVSVRITPSLKDSGYAAQLLAKAPQSLVASPQYLKAAGSPKSVKDLRNHNCLVHSIKSPTNLWSFSGKSGCSNVRVNGNVTANFGEALLSAALLGQGISMHPRYMIEEHLKAGRLSIVLPNEHPENLDVYAVFPNQRNLPTRVRTFLDFLRTWFYTTPAWARSAAAMRNPTLSTETEN